MKRPFSPASLQRSARGTASPSTSSSVQCNGEACPSSPRVDNTFVAAVGPQSPLPLLPLLLSRVQLNAYPAHEDQ